MLLWASFLYWKYLLLGVPLAKVERRASEETSSSASTEQIWKAESGYSQDHTASSQRLFPATITCASYMETYSQLFISNQLMIHSHKIFSENHEWWRSQTRNPKNITEPTYSAFLIAFGRQPSWGETSDQTCLLITDHTAVEVRISEWSSLYLSPARHGWLTD